jgi:polyphosphate kinase
MAVYQSRRRAGLAGTLSAISNLSDRSLVRIYKIENLVTGKIYIGSSDVMRRSFQERVELIIPLESANLKKELWGYLKLLIDEHCLRWEMQNDGTYERKNGKDALDVQQLLISHTSSPENPLT